MKFGYIYIVSIDTKFLSYVCSYRTFSLLISGIWDSMEGNGQRDKRDRGRKKDLRRFSKSNGCPTNFSRNCLSSIVFQSRKHHPIDRIAQGQQRSWHLPRFWIHGFVVSFFFFFRYCYYLLDNRLIRIWQLSNAKSLRGRMHVKKSDSCNNSCFILFNRNRPSQCHQKRLDSQRESQGLHHVSIIQGYQVHSFWKRDPSRPEGLQSNSLIFFCEKSKIDSKHGERFWFKIKPRRLKGM